MRWLVRVGAGAVVVYVAALGAVYFLQRKVMYMPEDTTRVPPSSFAELSGVREVELKTDDGLAILAWYAPPQDGRSTVVFFHGSQNALRGNRHRLLKFRKAGLGVLFPAYRGYAGSEGTPTEEGLYEDGRAALDWLNAQGTQDGAIVVYGKSLGTGVATKMAAERKVGLVVLEAPYTSVAEVGLHRFPMLSLEMLIVDKFDSLARMKDISAPVLIMHGKADRLIPQQFGRKLFDAANEPKEGYWPEGVGHDNVFDKGGFEVALDFIDRRLGTSGATPAPHAKRTAPRRKKAAA